VKSADSAPVSWRAWCCAKMLRRSINSDLYGVAE